MASDNSHDRDIESDYSINRRSLVKSIGATGAAAGFAGVAGANEDMEERYADRRQVAILNRSGPVQSLRQEVPNFWIPPRETTYMSSSEDGRDIHLFQSNTRSGKFISFKTDNGNALAILVLDLDSDNLPGIYRDVPGDTHPVLIGTEDGVGLRRQTTEKEHRKLAEDYGVNPEESTTVLDSKVGGFILSEAAKDSPRARAESDVEPDEHYLTVEYETIWELATPFDIQEGTAGEEDQGVSILHEEDDVVHRDDCVSEHWYEEVPCPDGPTDCISTCVDCLAYVATFCSICYFPCSGSATGWGAVVCALCIHASCGGLGGIVGCAPCYDCGGHFT